MASFSEVRIKKGIHKIESTFRVSGQIDDGKHFQGNPLLLLKMVAF